MGNIWFRPARVQDADWISERLSEEDQYWIKGETNVPPKVALREAIVRSPAKALCVEEMAGPFVNPLALFGIATAHLPADGRKVGQVWCVALDRLREDYGKSFTRSVKRLLDNEMKVGKWDMLYNREDADNAFHLRWVRFCGFKLMKRESDPAKNRNFVYFARFSA